MPLLLSVDQAGEMASDHHVRVIQHGIEPAPGGQQSLETNKTAKVSTACLQMWRIWGGKMTNSEAEAFNVKQRPISPFSPNSSALRGTAWQWESRYRSNICHLWSKYNPDSQSWVGMNRGSVFSAFIFSLSLEGGSMDFKQLRFCKRIVLEDKRCLWRLSAGRREAAARNCKAGLSANSQTKSIEFSCS